MLKRDKKRITLTELTIKISYSICVHGNVLTVLFNFMKCIECFHIHFQQKYFGSGFDGD